MTTRTPRPPAERTAAPGKNGVPIKKLGGVGGYYRTYEIYQRQRVTQSTHLVNPRAFNQPTFLTDPYPALATMREHYPCFRDWLNNTDWVTRYDDVTSVFQDDWNFESRSKLWYYGMESFGRDLRNEVAVLACTAARIDEAAPIATRRLLDAIRSQREAELIGDFVLPYPVAILAHVLGIPPGDEARFGTLWRQAMEGYYWNPQREQRGKEALGALAAWFDRLISERRAAPGEDLVSVMAGLELEGGPVTGADIATTLLEADGETLQGSLANTLYLLLTHPNQLNVVLGDERLFKRAWQEAMRHSGPVVQWRKYCLHEVERFGRLLPEGGQVMLSAAAANRDPRIFSDPDTYDVGRHDLCWREPRGQYRQDGLPAAIAPGLGKPTKHPAEPEDRPRSIYAITRDAAVLALRAILEELPDLRLADGAEPKLICRWFGDLHTCWDLPVTFGR